MNKALVFSIFKRRWREILIPICLLIGSLLIYSTRHLLPVFSDLMTVKIEKSVVVEDHLLSMTSRIEQSETDYISFLPLVTAYEAIPENPAREPVSETTPQGVTFVDGSSMVKILIYPPGSSAEDEKPIEVSFLPGEKCEFGDGFGCLNVFTLPGGQKINFVSVHSGEGGEGDDFRELIEGTGFNQGLYNPAEVLNRMKNLSGSQVNIQQGERDITGLSLEAIIRIPPELLKTYMDLPIERALAYALEQTSLRQERLDQDLLIIETCGWQLPNEAQIEGIPQNSSSVYLGIVGVNGD